jgi:hypothetical protein
MGNALEYAICQGLQKRKIAPFSTETSDKLKRLKRDFDTVNEPSRIKYRRLDSVLDTLGITQAKFPQYELTHETIGHIKADTSDLILHSPSDPKDNIKLSIKNNNTYIKHQRPNKLYLQLQLTQKESLRFISAYTAVNDRYFNLWKDLKTWNNVPTTKKFELYEEINQLTLKWISANPARLMCYLGFVLDAADPKKYILKWDPSMNDFMVITYNADDFSIKGKAAKYELSVRDSSFVMIKVGTKHLVQLRIHNASSRITKVLSLKYTTTIHSLPYKLAT